MLSFYRFFPVTSPEEVAARAKALLAEEGVNGTMYVANEGINGAFSVRSDCIVKFRDKVSSIHEGLGPTHVDFNLGETMPFSAGTAFKKLLVKARPFILTDHLPEEIKLNLQDSGREISPKEWHEETSRLITFSEQGGTEADGSEISVSGGIEDTPPLLLDCRNDYESRMGSFSGAVPLDTKTFGETWDRLDALLAHVPANQKIMTFCTGGIRCVKVNAYLKQKLGFQNVGSLKDGVIGYKAWLDEEGTERDEKQGREGGLEDKDSTNKSTFTGVNYVFDRRRVHRVDGQGEPGREDGLRFSNTPVS
jgi:predicted sulfurtransferase